MEEVITSCTCPNCLTRLHFIQGAVNNIKQLNKITVVSGNEEFGPGYIYACFRCGHAMLLSDDFLPTLLPEYEKVFDKIPSPHQYWVMGLVRVAREMNDNLALKEYVAKN